MDESPSLQSDQQHIDQEKRKLSGISQKLFDLIEFDQDESLVCEIRKHPIGLFFIYLLGIIIAGILFGVAVVGTLLLPDSIDIGVSVAVIRAVILLVGGILSVATIGVMFINAYIYKASVLFVTSDKIAQVLYKTIFNRKISQLSLGEIQDVTVSQDGFIARIFDYGNVVIETAGEQNNYVFNYVPFPYKCSKEIVAAHEISIRRYGN